MRVDKLLVNAVWLIAVAYSMTQPGSRAFGDTADLPASETVVPIQWARFDSGACASAAGRRFGKILLNANKYALNTWWETHGFDQTEFDGYLNFKGRDEHNIRPVATEAQGLAISLMLGLYNPDITGVPKSEATEKTVALIRSLAYRHRANSGNGWGSAWQSPLWAASAAMAGWLMWNQLDATDRCDVARMVESEAAWVMSNKGHPAIKTYRDRAGKIISPGDTGSEENAWDADVLIMATAMMPHSTNQIPWMNKMVELELAAFSRPSDLKRTEVFAGKPLSAWLPGSNANEDGTLINHGIVHPDYMVAGLFEFTPINAFSLAGMATPEAGIFNTDVIYGALANRNFIAGAIFNGKTNRPPGGTMFIPNSARVYYPEGDDWGTAHRLNYALADALISLFSKDPKLKREAAVWEEKHTEDVLERQARFSDGHTFLNATEFSYRSREEWISDLASRGYLLHWLVEKGAVTFTNQKYSQ